jgi:hypothetical protein
MNRHVWCPSFSLTGKENEAKETRPQLIPRAFGYPRATTACGGAENSPDVVGLRQFGPFIRMHPLREAALNGKKDYRKALRAHFSKAGPLGPEYLLVWL